MEERLVRYKGYVAGLRMWGLPAFLKRLAIDTDVMIHIDSVDKGWLRETVFYTINGTSEGVDKFIKHLRQVASI